MSSTFRRRASAEVTTTIATDSLNSDSCWNSSRTESKSVSLPIPIVAHSFSLSRHEQFCRSAFQGLQEYGQPLNDVKHHTRRKDNSAFDTRRCCEERLDMAVDHSSKAFSRLPLSKQPSQQQEKFERIQKSSGSMNSLSHSFHVHEDDLYNEMKQMIKNHRLAQKCKPLSERLDSENTSRLFISNSLTTKFLEENDTCLITVPDDLQISNIVDPSFHLRVGTILELDSMKEECLVQINFENNIIHRVIFPSFCLCLEDRVLYERMKRKRKKMLSRRREFDGEINHTFSKDDNHDEIPSTACLQSPSLNEHPCFNSTSNKDISPFMTNKNYYLSKKQGITKTTQKEHSAESKLPKRKHKSC
nr:unnamed protein product [Naegleria fowleri]